MIGDLVLSILVSVPCLVAGFAAGVWRAGKALPETMADMTPDEVKHLASEAARHRR